MSAVLTKALRDLRRRRLQTVVVALVVLLSSLAGAVALDLLVESDAPFDHAFAATNGAQLTLHVDSTHVTAAQLQATASLAPVSAAAGPWRELPLGVSATGVGKPGNFLALVGRPDPGGPVGQLQLVNGRWVQRTGEVVLSRRESEDSGLFVGDALVTDGTQGVSSLRVVGIAATVNDTADAWVTPAQAASLRMPVIPGGSAKGQQTPPPAWVMMYRLHDASTARAITAASNQIAHHLPADSVVDSSNWLTVRASADITTSVMIPFLLAFSVFALVVAAMIIGNVVSGAVIAGYRDIGVMKAIGFTPAQVLAVLVVQILIPATFGAATGAVAGLLASQPFLGQTADAFNLPTPSAFVPWVVVVCVGTALVIALLATVIPGLRAARLSAAEAITAGTSPALRRGHAVARLLARAPLPRPATLGATDSVARPVRAGMTLIAVALGVATVTFAAGLTASLGDVKAALVRDQQVQVVAAREGGGYLGTPMSDAQLTSVIQRQAGTQRVTAEAQAEAHITGLSQPIPIYGYRGASSWLGFVLINGRWFSGPGEAVAPTALFTTAGLHLGETVRITDNGRATTVRLVGEIFDEQGDNLLLRTDWPTLVSIAPASEPHTYDIAVSGDPRQYAQQLFTATSASPVNVEINGDRGLDTPFLLITTAVAGLALVLTLCALAGVFNTVVLNIREKARDMAILKALGMTRAQVVAMVLTSVSVIALVGVVIGIPAGMLLHHQILVTMGHIATGTAIPQQFFAVFPWQVLGGVTLAGFAEALLGAWMPAVWAARSPIGPLLAPE